MSEGGTCSCAWSSASCGPCRDERRDRFVTAFIEELTTFRQTPEDFVEPRNFKDAR